MKAQVITVLDTIAKMSVTNKEQIVFYSRFTNDTEYLEAITYLNRLGFIEEEDENYFITEFGLKWLLSTQNFIKVPNFHEITHLALDYIKYIKHNNRNNMTRQKLLTLFPIKNSLHAEEAIDLLLHERILLPERVGSETYDVIFDDYIRYLLGI